MKYNNNEYLANLLAAQMFNAVKNTIIKEANEIKNDKTKFRKFLEYQCETSVSDEDMLKVHIDMALADGDKEMFIELTNQLKEVAQAK